MTYGAKNMKALKPKETLEDLLCDDLKIIQHEDSYRFAIDSVLLSNFVKAKSSDRIIDLGTGSGVIPLLLSAKTKAREIVGLEIVEEVYERAKRSVKINDLEQRIKIVHGDLKHATKNFGWESFSVVVSNPPYMRLQEGKISPNRHMAIARHEVAATLEDVVEASRALLKFGGKFYMVYRTVRITDVLFTLRDKGIEPKLLRFIHPREGQAPNLFLLMAQKGGKPGVKMLSPLVIYNNSGDYTEEINQIYFGQRQWEAQK